MAAYSKIDRVAIPKMLLLFNTCECTRLHWIWSKTGLTRLVCSIIKLLRVGVCFRRTTINKSTNVWETNKPFCICLLLFFRSDELKKKMLSKKKMRMCVAAVFDTILFWCSCKLAALFHWHLTQKCVGNNCPFRIPAGQGYVVIMAGIRHLNRFAGPSLNVLKHTLIG
jgi:hypothetical protein